MHTRPRLKKSADKAPVAPVDHSFYPPFAPPVESSSREIQNSPHFSRNNSPRFDSSNTYANYTTHEFHYVNKPGRKLRSPRKKMDFEDRRKSDNILNSVIFNSDDGKIYKGYGRKSKKMSHQRSLHTIQVPKDVFYKVKEGSPRIRRVPRTKKKPKVRLAISRKNTSQRPKTEYPKTQLGESQPKFKIDIPRPDKLIPPPAPSDLDKPRTNRSSAKESFIDPNSISRFPNPLPKAYQRYLKNFEKIFRYSESTFQFNFRSADLQHCSDGGYFQAVLNGRTRKGKIFGKFMTGDGCLFYGLFNTNQDYEYYRDGYLFLQRFFEGMKVYPHGRKAEYGRFNGETLIQGGEVKL